MKWVERLPLVMWAFIFLLSLWLGQVTGSQGALAFSIDFSPHSATVFPVAPSSSVPSPNILVDAPTPLLLAQNSEKKTEQTPGMSSLDLPNLLKRLEVQILIAVVLLLSLVLLPRLFGYLLTGAAVAIFLILLVATLAIFAQNFSSIIEPTSSPSSSSSPTTSPSSIINIYVSSESSSLPKATGSPTALPNSQPSLSVIATSGNPNQSLHSNDQKQSPPPQPSPTSLLNYLHNLWRVLGLVILLGVLALVLHWLSGKGGIVVLPFEVASKELLANQGKKETGNSRETENYYGKAIADLLIEELYRIQKIHALPQDLLQESTDNINIRLGNRNFPPLSAVQNQLGDTLTDIGTVEVGKAQFSPGRLLLSLRKIWPFGGLEGIITGSLQTYGKLTRIVVRVEYGNQVKAWEVTRKSPEITAIPQDMIRELAYKVVFEILPRKQLVAGTWEAFRDVTEAISHFVKYFRTQSIDELDQASSHLDNARKCDCRLMKQSGKRSELVADFFYKLGFSYFLQSRYREAEKNMKIALEVDSSRENYYYYYNGLGNIYWKLKKTKDAKFEYKRSIHHLERLRIDHCFKPWNSTTLGNWIQRFLQYLGSWILFHGLGYFSYLHLIKDVPQPIKQSALAFPYPDNGLGNLAFEQGDFPAAKNFYETAIRADKNFWRPYHNLGNIYLYEHDLFDQIKSYDEARQNFERSVKISRCQDFGSSLSHSGLGLACFFKAIASQSDLLIIHSRIFNYLDGSSQIDIDIEALSILSLQVDDLLTEALHEVQLAVDIDGENAVLHWNLGLVKLWHSSLDEVQNIWGKAIEKARQEKQDLCCAVYGYVRTAISPHQALALDSCMRAVKTCLTQQVQQGTLKPGNLKMMLKDLSVVQIMLLRQMIQNISAADGYSYNLENQPILQASQHITTLQETLQRASAASVKR